MSTQDIPDNELDDLFRKSLEEPDIEFREEDWLQLEKKMDIATRQKAIFRKYLYSLLVLILLGSIVSVVLWMNYTDPDTEAASIPVDFNAESHYATKENIKSPDENTADAPTSGQLKSGQKSVPSQQQSEGPEIIQEAPLAEKNNTEDNNVLKKQASKQVIKEKRTPALNTRDTPVKEENEDRKSLLPGQYQKERAVVTQQPAMRNGEPVGTEYHTDQERQTTTGKRITGKSPGKAAPKTMADNTITYSAYKPAIRKPGNENKQLTDESNLWNIADTTITETSEDYTRIESTAVNWPVLALSRLPVTPLVSHQRLAVKYAEKLKSTLPAKPENVQPHDSTDTRQLAKKRINYRFSISLALSPDLSTVRLSELTKPGTNIGILLNYRFSPKISISTGIIRSAKIYDARIEDYSPPPGQWTYYIKPVEIKASCTVLDIPVNIRYTLSEGKKFSVYAVTGLSSYLMLSEHYKYIYNVDDTHLRKYWQVKNENKHFFKLYNISAGYEQKISKRVSAGAEPFLKIPGAGVGFGKIHLWSAGIFISANYHLGK